MQDLAVYPESGVPEGKDRIGPGRPSAGTRREWGSGLLVSRAAGRTAGRRLLLRFAGRAAGGTARGDRALLVPFDQVFECHVAFLRVLDSAGCAPSVISIVRIFFFSTSTHFFLTRLPNGNRVGRIAKCAGRWYNAKKERPSEGGADPCGQGKRCPPAR